MRLKTGWMNALACWQQLRFVCELFDERWPTSWYESHLSFLN